MGQHLGHPGMPVFLTRMSGQSLHHPATSELASVTPSVVRGPAAHYSCSVPAHPRPAPEPHGAAVLPTKPVWSVAC